MALMEAEIEEHLHWIYLFCLFGYDIMISTKWIDSDCLSLYTDKDACILIVKKGSNKNHLHDLAKNIWNICFQANMKLEVFWIPR